MFIKSYDIYTKLSKIYNLRCIVILVYYSHFPYTIDNFEVTYYVCVCVSF